MFHWTGGTHHPNQVDYMHYHFLITGDGLVVQGDFTPEDNLDCTQEGKYAQGAKGCNTGVIHIAYCGMYGYRDSADYGLYPLKEKQCEAGFKLCAELCKKYDIAITEKTVFTHYEFECRKGTKRKVDINCLPYKKMPEKEVGSFIRKECNKYFMLSQSNNN